MGALTINNEIRTRFNTAWNDLHPVAWPNVKFTPVIGVLWCRIDINILTTHIMNIGAVKNYRTPGIITIQIFSPKNEGDSIIMGVADVVAAIFRNWVGETIKCRESSIQVIGSDPQGDDWYQVNVVTTFVEDELI